MPVSGGRYSEVAGHLRQLRHSPASWGWFALVLGVQTLVACAGGVAAQQHWFETLGLSRDGFLAGKIWQIGSYGLLHGSWWHAWLNACLALGLGSRIERILGSAALVWVTMAGVVAGGLCHLLLGTGLLVGLSGGCLAQLLLLTTLSPQSRMWPLPVSGKSLGWGVMVAAGGFMLIDPGLGVPGVSAAGRMLAVHGWGAWFQMGHACHFGGGLAGWWIGRRLLRPPVTLEQLRRARARREHP